MKTSSPFLNEVVRAVRVRHYSIRTEQAYVGWIKRFIVFHGKRHPREMGAAEVGDFLSHLAVTRNVAANTQNQALNALVFLYKAVLDQPLGDLHGVVRAKKPRRLPVVLSHDEVRRILSHLDGIHWLAICLLSGTSMKKTLLTDTAPSGCRMHWQENIRMRQKNGAGNIFSRPVDAVPIRAQM